MHKHPDLMTAEEVAKYLQLHVMSIYRRLAEGKLPGGFRLGGRWRVHRSVLDKALMDGEGL